MTRRERFVEKAKEYAPVIAVTAVVAGVVAAIAAQKHEQGKGWCLHLKDEQLKAMVEDRTTKIYFDKPNTIVTGDYTH